MEDYVDGTSWRLDGVDLVKSVSAFYKIYSPESVSATETIITEFRGEEAYLLSELCKLYCLSQTDMQKFFEPSTLPDSNVNNYEQRSENENDSDEYSTVVSLFSTGSPDSSNSCGDSSLNKNKDDSNNDSMKNNYEHDGCDNCDSSDRIMPTTPERNKRRSISLQAELPWIGIKNQLGLRENCNRECDPYNSSDSRISTDIRRESENDRYGDSNIDRKSGRKFYSHAGDENNDNPRASNDCLETVYAANSHDLSKISSQAQFFSEERSSCKKSKQERQLKMKSDRDRFLSFDSNSVDGSSSINRAIAIEDMDYSRVDFNAKGGAKDLKRVGGTDCGNGEFSTRIQYTGKHIIPVLCEDDDQPVTSTRHVPPTSGISCDGCCSSSLLESSPSETHSTSTASTFTTHSTISLSQIEERDSLPLDASIRQSCGLDCVSDLKKSERLNSEKDRDFSLHTQSARQSDVCNQKICNIVDIGSSHPSMSALYTRHTTDGLSSSHPLEKLKFCTNQLHSKRCNASLHDPIVKNQVFNDFNCHLQENSGFKLSSRRQDSYDYLVEDTEQWQSEEAIQKPIEYPHLSVSTQPSGHIRRDPQFINQNLSLSKRSSDFSSRRQMTYSQFGTPSYPSKDSFETYKAVDRVLVTCATHEDPSHINNSNQTAFPKNFDALIQPRSSTANPAITTSFVVSAASATTVAAEVADTTTHSQMQLLAHGQSGGYQILKYSIPYSPLIDHSQYSNAVSPMEQMMHQEYLSKQDFYLRDMNREKSSQKAYSSRLGSQIKANNRASISALLRSSLSISTDSLPSSFSPSNPPAAFSHSKSSTPLDSYLRQSSPVHHKENSNSKAIYPNVMCSSLPSLLLSSDESCSHYAPPRSLVAPRHHPNERVRAGRGRERELPEGFIKRKLSASISPTFSSHPSSCEDTQPISMSSIRGPLPYGAGIFDTRPRIDIAERTSDTDTDTDINHRWALAIDQKSLKWYYYDRFSREISWSKPEGLS